MAGLPTRRDPHTTSCPCSLHDKIALQQTLENHRQEAQKRLGTRLSHTAEESGRNIYGHSSRLLRGVRESGTETRLHLLASLMGFCSKSYRVPVLQPTSPTSPLGVMFLTGYNQVSSIKIYFSLSRLREKIVRVPDGKLLPPPDDLEIQRKEQVLFQNPKTSTFSSLMIATMCITTCT